MEHIIEIAGTKVNILVWSENGAFVAKASIPSASDGPCVSRKLGPYDTEAEAVDHACSASRASILACALVTFNEH